MKLLLVAILSGLALTGIGCKTVDVSGVVTNKMQWQEAQERGFGGASADVFALEINREWWRVAPTFYATTGIGDNIIEAKGRIQGEHRTLYGLIIRSRKVAK